MTDRRGRNTSRRYRYHTATIAKVALSKPSFPKSKHMNLYRYYDSK